MEPIFAAGRLEKLSLSLNTIGVAVGFMQTLDALEFMQMLPAAWGYKGYAEVAAGRVAIERILHKYAEFESLDWGSTEMAKAPQPVGPRPPSPPAPLSPRDPCV